MRILIACEESGTVRDAFTKLGHDAMSCDLQPSRTNGKHYQGSVFDIINDGWDMMIAHPPCTHIAVSGARHFKQKIADGRQQEAIDFFMAMINAPIERIAVENPICIMSRVYKKPDQIIQPFMFGDAERKTTCLWLKNMPLLIPTNIVEPELIITPAGDKLSKWHYDSYKLKNEDKSKMRSKTFQGMADAMAEQWSKPFTNLKNLQSALAF